MSLLRREDISKMAYPEWLIDGVLPAGGVSMVYGKSGTGKSFWVLDLACCVDTGRKWAGRQVKQGPVVYVAGEGRHGYAARLDAWEKKHGVRAETFSLYDEPVRLWSPDHRTPDSLQRFVEAVNGARVRPALVVFDTLGTCLGGADENSNGNMRELLDNAEDIGRTWDADVLFVHHTGKQGESARGAQALQDGMAMHAHYQGDGKSYGVLTGTKQKDGQLFEPIRRTLHTVSLGKGLESLAFADDHKNGARDRRRHRLPWEEIRKLLAGGDIPMTPKTIALVLQAEGWDTNNDAVQAHLARAEKRKEVQGDDNGAYALMLGYVGAM